MEKRQSYISSFLLLCVMLLVSFGILFSPRLTPLAAQAADTILRPILGSKNTIALESIYFSLGNEIASLQYHFFGSRPVQFSTTIQHDTKKIVNSPDMGLKPLPLVITVPVLVNEGVWVPIPENLFPGQTVMASTVIRPDPATPYATVSLVEMDMKKLALGLVAGTYYPGGQRHMYGSGLVPLPIQQSSMLLAAFNGGFQEKDGEYGMVVGDKVYVPLRSNMPTLLIHQDGSVSFTTYTAGQLFPSDVIAERQNGPFLVKSGIVSPYVEASVDSWGRTTTNSMYTWRSGMGITKDGNLIYAVGNALVPKTLATALKDAGAVDAIQLDINPFWVRFFLYNSLGNGKYNFYPLLSNMQDGGLSYLKGYNKDFFFVYKKSAATSHLSLSAVQK